MDDDQKGPDEKATAAKDGERHKASVAMTGSDHFAQTPFDRNAADA